MTDKKQTTPVIANAIIWAAVMIGTSLILAGQSPDQKEALMLLFIVGWFMSNQMLTKGGQALKADLSCFRRLLGKN